MTPVDELDRVLPTVSFVITSYNYEKYIAKCVKSALDQDWASEVIVVDDGSVDSSVAILRGFGSDIVLIEQNRGGQGAAINAGIAAATGEIVLLLDSDDWSSPRRSRMVAEAFARDASADWMIHNVAETRSDDPVGGAPLYQLLSPEGLLDDLITAGDTRATTSGLAFRRSFLQRVGPIPPIFSIYPDCYLVNAAILSGRALLEPESLSFRRIHGSQASGQRRFDPTRAKQLIDMKYELAESVGRLAGRSPGSPRCLAERSTWWQTKAILQRAKASADTSRRGILSRWWRLVRAAAVDPDMSTTRKALFVGRETAMAVLPRWVFERAWWLLHYGRPVFLEKYMSRVAISVPAH